MGVYLQKRADGTTYGTYVIDRYILGQRFKKSTGSKDLRTSTRMNDMIDDLISRGLDSHLRNLLKNKVSIRQLFELYQTGALFNPSLDPSQVQPLRDTLEEWTTSYSQWSDSTRRVNRELLRSMFNKIDGEFPSPTIEDIPVLLRWFRERCEREKTFRSFNMVRSILHRFVRLRYGKSSMLYARVSDVEKLREKKKLRQTAKTPGQIDRLCRNLPEKYRRMVWTMCTTGVGWKEYDQLVPRDDMKNPRIYIGGTKMDHVDGRRRREVPYVYAPHPRAVSEKRFRRKIREVSEKLRMKNVRPYTFRKCYSNWLSEAGVPQWRVRMYMGHQPKSQTEQYQTTEVWRWLKEDGERLRSWIEVERKKQGLK